METIDWKWPAADTLATDIQNITSADTQPYEQIDIYILKSERIKQEFLYGPNNFIDSSKLERIINKFYSSETYKNMLVAAPVILCVKAAKEDPDGVYYAYHEYPPRLQKIFPPEVWKTWVCTIMVDNRLAPTFEIFSDTPPIPGCLMYMDDLKPELNKFYYPEEILPAFKAIYPNAKIPEDQILREGRDY